MRLGHSLLRRRLRVDLCLVLWIATLGSSLFAEDGNRKDDGSKSLQSEEEPLAIFEKRILPIFRAEKPSSCAECHLSGVDLKDYIHPDQKTTFANLTKHGLVDVKNPDKSKILEFIQRSPGKPNLITARVRQEEYEAFRTWIRAAVRDRELLAAPAVEAALGPKVPDEVIRHARKDRVLNSFLENVWSEGIRCVHCHSPEFNRKHIEKFGREFVDRISWIVPDDPAGSLQRIVDSGLIDMKSPEDSLLLTKPTLQVEHRGGKKFLTGDRTYKQFRRFIDDYAAIVTQKYKTAESLPTASAEFALLSNTILQITDIPAKHGGKLLHVELFRRDEQQKNWLSERWASAEWLVIEKQRMWQFRLHLTAPRDSSRAKEIAATKQLPSGRYLLKLYVDQEEKLESNPDAEPGSLEFVGQLEVESRWGEGPERKTVVRFPSD